MLQAWKAVCPPDSPESQPSPCFLTFRQGLTSCSASLVAGVTRLYHQFQLLRNFAAVPGTVSGWAVGWVAGPCFSEAAPLVAGAGGEGAGAAMPHPGVQAIGHRE